ncbi:hypothetical protein L218DRAFT_1058716 [Marasmius fiardii PR-910]|nr:hypothetical protein L218DRAFT_1058716 [Marasmius fiardii PR-910]
MENQDISVSPTSLCPNCHRSLPAQSFPRVELAKLRSNFLPSSTEKSSTRHILEREKDQLKLYGEELDRLDGIVKILKEERRKLARQIEEHESWIAGIRHLPVQYLAKIFLLVCASEDGTLSIIRKSGGKTQITAPALTLAGLASLEKCCILLSSFMDVHPC